MLYCLWMASSAGVRGGVGAADAAMLVPNKFRNNKRSRAAQTTAAAADLSVLRPSISVNVTGMKQAVKVLSNGTPEVYRIKVIN